MSVCKQCGNKFKQTNNNKYYDSKYCSRECRVLSIRKRKPALKGDDHITKNCIVCGSVFSYLPKPRNGIRHDSRQTCSTDCSNEHKEQIELAKVKICKQCGNEFKSQYSAARYCSSECRYGAVSSPHDESIIETRECANCGVAFPANKSYGVVFCSEPCRDEIKKSRQHIGGGLSKSQRIELKRYLAPRWKKERHKLGLNIFEAALKIGITKGMLFKLENETYPHLPSRGTSSRASGVYGVSISYLTGNSIMDNSDEIMPITTASNSHGLQAITLPETEFIYDSEPPDRNAKCLLLTVGGIAVIGAWGDGSGISAWYPLPKRRKPSNPKLNRDPSSSDKPQQQPAA